MSLPSKYSSEGLSAADQKRTITIGKPRPKEPIHYKIRQIESRIQDASDKNEDIEMVPMDDATEVGIISDYVNARRLHNDLPYILEPQFPPSASNHAQKEAKTFLVVDTNFILSHLNILNDLKSIANDYRYQIIIPMTVMSELDGLKKSNRIPSSDVEVDSTLSGKSVGFLARWANDWIYSSLADSNPSVRGQKVNETLNVSAKQDDSILDCCLYLQKRHDKSLVVLMSNDKNFCLKALSNNILTISYRSGMSAPLIAQTVHTEMALRFPNENIHDETVYMEEDSMGTQEVHQEEQSANTNHHPIKLQQPPQTIQEKCSAVYNEVEKLLIFVVRKCMRTNYGEDIDLVRDYDEDSVVSISQGSQLIGRFWQPVFQSYFRSKSSNLKKEDVTIGFDTVPADQEELRHFIAHWEVILRILYIDEMDDKQNQALMTLIDRWFKMVQ